VTLPVVRSAHALSAEEKVIYDCLDEIGKSSSEIVRLSGYSKNKTLRILADLEQTGYVKKSGNGRGTKYSIRL
jgi:ATP-dependent DNA helicase RecG